eukprot:SAG22_NODE_864_length_6788_cov_2.700553_6_plen_325_part_00
MHILKYVVPGDGGFRRGPAGARGAAMAGGAMPLSPEQWYHWDVSGRLVLPNAVDPAALAAAVAAAGEAAHAHGSAGGASTHELTSRLMAALPNLSAVLEQLFGEPEGESQQVGYRLPGLEHNFFLQRLPEKVGTNGGGGGGDPPAGPLRGSDRRRCYYNERLVNLPYPDGAAGLPRGIVTGVTVLAAAEDGCQVWVVPASHSAMVPPPAAPGPAPGPAGPGGGGESSSSSRLHPAVEAALQPVALAAGDLLVLPANLLHRVGGGGGGGGGGRLVAFEFAHHTMAPQGGYEQQAEPGWLAELSPLERRLIAGREFGQVSQKRSYN